MTGRRAPVMVLLLAWCAGGWFAPRRSDAEGKKVPESTSASALTMASGGSTVRRAGERVVAGGALGRSRDARESPRVIGSQRSALGPRIPEHLRQALAASIERRIERDISGERSLRIEATALLETFIKEEAKSARELPEALMRLGELYWEDERERFVARFAQWEKGPTDQRGPAPEPSYARPRALFARVLSDYPNFEAYDLALYVDGFMATEQGRHDEALARFNRILLEFPQSRFAPDAHMARAEAAFNGKYDYAAALFEYEQVMRYRQSDLYGLALFKSAWCQWRLGHSDEAAQRFLQTFRIAEDDRAVSAQKRRQLDELQAEALKYLVEVFTEDERNSAAAVYDFLVKAGGDKFAGRIVKALASAFYEQAHYERGIEAYELMQKLDPAGEEAPAYGLSVADGYATIEDWPKLELAYQRVLKSYAAPDSAWARAQSRPDVVKAVVARIEAQLRRDATNLHGKAQRDKTSRAEYQGAAALYELYLGRFAAEPGAYDAEFALAELQSYHLDRYSDAATHYMAVARRAPKGPLTHDALYNAIAALERARSLELASPSERAGSEVDKKFTEAMELYIQLYPDDPSVPELLFRQGKLYYDHRVFDAAVRQWGLLLEKYPTSKFAAGAGELALDSFNQSRDYGNIEVWARRLKAAPSFRDPARQKRLDTLIVQSVFKRGEQLAAAGKYDEAALSYLRAAREFPRDVRAAQACANAALAAQKAGNVGTLKAAVDLLISAHEGAPEAPATAFTAATQFQSMGLFSEAAAYDEVIVERFPRSEHVKEAAYNSVLLRSAVGDYDRAIANGKRYRQQYGNSAEADDVALLMGKAHERQKHWREAAELYRSDAKSARTPDRRSEAYVRLATVLVAEGAWRPADEALSEAVLAPRARAASLGPGGQRAVAHARYMQGERILSAFADVQIAGDAKKLSTRLKQKAELLKQAATIFLDCVGMGVAEWSTAALYQIGHTYEEFAASLRDAPVPENLTGADKEAYQQQIESFVVPIEEKSLEAYESGWKKAVELGIFNSWTAKMREALGRLNGELYPPMKEIGCELRLSTPAALPTLLTGPRASGVRAAAPRAAVKR